MTVVVDASVLIAALVDAQPKGNWAEDVLLRGPICGPELLLVETANILRRLERAKTIVSLAAAQAYQDLMQLDAQLFSFAPFADRVWELRQTLTSYDAWYVAVAEAIEAPLATLDRRLSRTSGPRCDFLLP